MRRPSGRDARNLARAVSNNPRIRSAAYQLALILAVIWVGSQFAVNAAQNLAERRSGFGFLFNTAGFGIDFTLIPYSETDTYGRVFLVGLLNTVLVSAIGIVFATLIGFLIGIGRLSSNWLIARLAGGYVELIRNLPLLFQILFWYLAVLGTLPGPRQSLSVLGIAFMNNRGFWVPALHPGERFRYVWVALLLGVAATAALGLWARRVRERTGRQNPVFWPGLALILALPLATFLAAGMPMEVDLPHLAGFNFVGGSRIIPEFVALLVALSIYTASFIAEVVRAGILAVPRGQSEAGLALGLNERQVLRLIVLPQALRIIVPPLTNQYLNLTKNSSLAVAIGYPDLFAVFAGTTLNQTGQAIEIIAITMGVYLSLSLATSLAMNWYNSRVQLADR
ncbi:MAG TPA: amino acid ABC transporter permease [Xanthobacteraceae bacterium]|nr:amino acid ABC transporter permease [Xanthobacteraceae bacterium]